MKKVKAMETVAKFQDGKKIPSIVGRLLGSGVPMLDWDYVPAEDMVVWERGLSGFNMEIFHPDLGRYLLSVGEKGVSLSREEGSTGGWKELNVDNIVGSGKINKKVP